MESNCQQSAQEQGLVLSNISAEIVGVGLVGCIECMIAHKNDLASILVDERTSGRA